MRETFGSVWVRCWRNYEEGKAEGLLDSVALSCSCSCLFHTVSIP